uniref:Uncharacterized protein n=1 Tax=Caulerpa lentillifera TaxID=148947 RepID=A0A2Z2QKK3_9CHLO|nr:hypothetical protein [Caulerpa lentillifera]AST24238.1 hypothetical protein [Caulerpa lentillifera]QKS32244.1 hypothetical protein [Caulerpa lentillifera]
MARSARPHKKRGRLLFGTACCCTSFGRPPRPSWPFRPSTSCERRSGQLALVPKGPGKLAFCFQGLGQDYWLLQAKANDHVLRPEFMCGVSLLKEFAKEAFLWRTIGG